MIGENESGSVLLEIVVDDCVRHTVVTVVLDALVVVEKKVKNTPEVRVSFFKSNRSKAKMWAHTYLNS